VLDPDSRQRSLTRYLENREAYAAAHDLGWAIPEHLVATPSTQADVREREQEETELMDSLMDRLAQANDFVVIDCPGGLTHFSQLAHAMADTLLTPMNDSFVDLDLLARVDPETYAIDRLSLYAESVWDSRKVRGAAGLPGTDWVVIRNRISTTQSKNRQRMDDALKSLQKRIAFRYISGLSDRVIYRELFPKGLTLVDLKEIKGGPKMTMSHVAARYELRKLLDQLSLPGWNR
jgi:chromosome partitioning protein